MVSTRFKTFRLPRSLSKRLLRFDPWLLTVLISFAVLSWANWSKLQSPIIDLGREVEIPARLADGQVLYRDIITLYGPLSYYVGALALRLFGHHLEVFYSLSLLLSLAATLLFYYLAKRLMDAAWAALCSLCFLIYCAVGPGLFNFNVPYCYGSVYAIVLCLLAAVCFDQYVRFRQLLWLVVAAIACGLTGISKQEYGVAMLGGLLFGVNLDSAQTLRQRVKGSLLIIVTAALVALIPLALLAQQITWQVLTSSLVPVSQLNNFNRSWYYQGSFIKTLHIWSITLGRFLVTAVPVGSAVALRCKFISPKVVSLGHPSRWGEVGVSVAFVWLSMKLLSQMQVLNQIFQFNPKFTSLVGIPGLFFNPLCDLSWCLPVLAVWFVLSRAKFRRDERLPLLGALLIFALLVNARWLFFINFYGLYAVVVVLLFFVLLYHSVHRFRSFVWHCLLICVLVAGIAKFDHLLTYRYPVSSAYGTFYSQEQQLAQSFNQTIAVITDSKASKVLVLPEGNLLNFLTATHSPSRELTFLPYALPTAQDEQNFITYMEAHPPDLIVYVPRSFDEWNYQSYAEVNPQVDRWIKQQHPLIHTFPIGKDAIRIYAASKR